MPTLNQKIFNQIDQQNKYFSDDIFLSCLDDNYATTNQDNDNTQKIYKIYNYH